MATPQYVCLGPKTGKMIKVKTDHGERTEPERIPCGKSLDAAIGAMPADGKDHEYGCPCERRIKLRMRSCVAPEDLKKESPTVADVWTHVQMQQAEEAKKKQEAAKK